MVLQPKYIIACSTHARGAMALLLFGGIDNIFGCWNSNQMMKYLNNLARPLLHKFASVIIKHREYIQLSSPYNLFLSFYTLSASEGPPPVRLTNRYFPAKRPADLSEGTIPISTFHVEPRVPTFCLDGRPAAVHVLEVDTHNSITTLSTSPMCSHCLPDVIELS